MGKPTAKLVIREHLPVQRAAYVLVKQVKVSCIETYLKQNKIACEIEIFHY